MDSLPKRRLEAAGKKGGAKLAGCRFKSSLVLLGWQTHTHTHTSRQTVTLKKGRGFILTGPTDRAGHRRGESGKEAESGVITGRQLRRQQTR